MGMTWVSSLARLIPRHEAQANTERSTDYFFHSQLNPEAGGYQPWASGMDPRWLLHVGHTFLCSLGPIEQLAGFIDSSHWVLFREQG